MGRIAPSIKCLAAIQGLCLLVQMILHLGYESIEVGHFHHPWVCVAA